jgi:fimbrial chaperone protein
MLKLFQSILTMFAVVGSAEAAPDTSALKLAFQKSRAEKNIDIVLPVFLKARLFIVTGGQAATKDYFLVPSPNKERFCVTVSENVDNLKNIEWPKVEATGEQLIKSLPPGVEIVVVYKDGGDYITREHLQWYRSLIR